MTVPYDGTPQRIGGRRFVLSKAKRIELVRGEVAAHQLVLASRLTALPKATDAVKVACTQLGLPYRISGCRCSPQPCYARDCSGLIYFAVNRLLSTNLCGSSFGLAALGQDHGTGIPQEEAIWTPFALGIRCAFCAPNAIGSNGHVVAMMGDGKTTVEEGGRRTGCYNGHATGRGFDYWMTYPGLDYSVQSVARQELDMFVQTHHYDAHGKPVSPARPPQGYESNRSIVRVSDDGSCIEARWGASIANDQPADGNRPFVLRRWYPSKPLAADARFTGVCFRAPEAGDPIPGGVASVTDGTTREFRLS